MKVMKEARNEERKVKVTRATSARSRRGKENLGPDGKGQLQVGWWDYW